MEYTGKTGHIPSPYKRPRLRWTRQLFTDLIVVGRVLCSVACITHTLFSGQALMLIYNNFGDASVEWKWTILGRLKTWLRPGERLYLENWFVWSLHLFLVGYMVPSFYWLSCAPFRSYMAKLKIGFFGIVRGLCSFFHRAHWLGESYRGNTVIRQSFGSKARLSIFRTIAMLSLPQQKVF